MHTQHTRQGHNGAQVSSVSHCVDVSVAAQMLTSVLRRIVPHHSSNTQWLHSGMTFLHAPTTPAASSPAFEMANSKLPAAPGVLTTDMLRA